MGFSPLGPFRAPLKPVRSSSDEGSSLFCLSHSSFGLPSSPLSPFQIQVDHLVTQGGKEIIQPSSLFSLLTGSLANRLAKVGVLGMKVGAYCNTPLRAISIGLGLGSEVTAFELSYRTLHTIAGGHVGPPLQEINTDLWKWQGPGGWKEGLGTSLVTFSMLRGASFLGQRSNFIFGHALSSTAMVAGHQTAATFQLIPTPEGSLTEQLFHAEITNLEWQGMGGLLLSLAPGVSRLERGLDLLIRAQPPVNGGRVEGNPLFSQMAMEGATSPHQGSKNPFRPFLLSKSIHGGSSSDQSFDLTGRHSLHLPTDGEAKVLKEDFRPQFPPESVETYTEAILHAAVSTPSPFPHFHHRLLEAYAKSSQAGSRAQILTAGAIQHLFLYNALNSSTGSFENAVLQLLITQALNGDRFFHRMSAMNGIFSAMEKGPTRSSLYRLMGAFGLGRGFETFLEPHYSYEFWRKNRSHLKGFLEEDQIQWANHIYDLAGSDPAKARRLFKLVGEGRRSGNYDGAQIDEAMNFAKIHPLGKLVLNRMLYIFAAGDVTAKLKELRPQAEEKDSFTFISDLAKGGLTEERIAQTINGTVHTAYLEDMRLAVKVASVFLDTAPFLAQPFLRQAASYKLHRAVSDFLESGKNLTPEELFKLLRLSPDPQIASYEKSFEQGDFDIEMSPAHKFQKEINPWHPNCHLSFYDHQRGEARRKTIVILELPESSATTRDVIGRLSAFKHELEHLRHFSGIKPLRLGGSYRHDRLVSEAMADLEKQRLNLKMIDDDFHEFTRRLSANLPLFFRDLNDYAYYGRFNERKLEALFPSK